jgi:RNA polymerase sigma-70 factor (ECF subfamily)
MDAVMPILPLNQPDPEPKNDADAASAPSRARMEGDSSDPPESWRDFESRVADFRTVKFNDDEAEYRERVPMRGRIARQQGSESSRLQNDARPAPGMSSAEENNMLQRIHMGSEESLGEFYDRYGKMLYSVALRVLRDPSAAEDVLCDVYLDIWRNTENYLAIRGPLAGWLAVMVRNWSIDALRRKRPLQTMEDIVLASNFDLALESERTMMMGKARSVIYALPSEQRKTLEMAFFDGLTHIEISEMSGENESVICARLRAALLTLRKAMQA